MTIWLGKNCIFTPNGDDPAGRIKGVLHSAIQILYNISRADTVSPELLDQLLDYLEKALSEKQWFDYGDFGSELLQVAEQTALRTEPGRYIKLLDKLIKIHEGKRTEYFQEDIKKKIRFYEATGRPEEVGKIIAENMDIVEVRRGVVQKEIQKGEFIRAKQLIVEGILIAEQKQHPGTVQKWRSYCSTSPVRKKTWRPSGILPKNLPLIAV